MRGDNQRKLARFALAFKPVRALAFKQLYLHLPAVQHASPKPKPSTHKSTAREARPHKYLFGKQAHALVCLLRTDVGAQFRRWGPSFAPPAPECVYYIIWLCWLDW